MTHSNIEHPKNSITLMNGAVIECYPKESSQTGFVPDKMKLDRTGVYLSVGNKALKPQPRSTEEVEIQKKLFTDNAFFLLSHRERIMRDSRMFLAPVMIQNGLAYTGVSGFHNPTVGIYLEWWSLCLEAMRIDKDGNRSLVFHLAGSPLSGANHCSEVYEDGRIEQIHLSCFSSCWKPFMEINTRYDEAKHIYQAYTLEELLAILRNEDKGELNYTREIKECFMQHEIDTLKKRVEQLTEESDKWYNMYTDTFMKYNDARISKAFAEFQFFKGKTETEIDLIKLQKRELKIKLKSGNIDNIIYQRTLMPMNKRIEDLEFSVSTRKYNLLNQFLAEGINYSTIESYMNNKNNI